MNDLKILHETIVNRDIPIEIPKDISGRFELWNNYLHRPYVDPKISTWDITVEHKPTNNPSLKEPLTLTAVQDNTKIYFVYFSQQASYPILTWIKNDIKYQSNCINYYDKDHSAPFVTLNKGESVQVLTVPIGNYCGIFSESNIKVSGNDLSIYFGEDYLKHRSKEKASAKERVMLALNPA